MNIKSKINLRTDVISRNKFEKSNLTRIGISKNGETILNSNNGRGIYFYELNLDSKKKVNLLKYYVNNKKGNFQTIEEKILEIYNKNGGDNYGK